jgi:hypothetical protein
MIDCCQYAVFAVRLRRAPARADRIGLSICSLPRRTVRGRTVDKFPSRLQTPRKATSGAPASKEPRQGPRPNVRRGLRLTPMDIPSSRPRNRCFIHTSVQGKLIRPIGQISELAFTCTAKGKKLCPTCMGNVRSRTSNTKSLLTHGAHVNAKSCRGCASLRNVQNTAHGWASRPSWSRRKVIRTV